MHPFRNLLLVSLGRETALQRRLNAVEWNGVFQMARFQTLLGVTWEGILRLPEEQQPPKELRDRWEYLAGKIAQVYRLHCARIGELEKILSGLNLQGCVLKGTGLSKLYPVPGSRMCGDVDLWVKGTHESILGALEPVFPVREILYQECKLDFFPDVEVEIHFHPSKMYNPFLNARLQRFFEQNAPFGNATLTYPDARFNAVFCMAHMFHHYLEGGIGLRQMMDYYYILRALDPADRQPVMQELRRLGMGRFTAAMMESLRFNFGLEEAYYLCPPDAVRGRQLMEATIRGGNFGILDRRNYQKKAESRLHRFFRKSARVLSYFFQYPREVAWAPYARLHHFFWRLLKGYL